MANENEQAEQLRKDYREVFESESGIRVLEDLEKTCFFNDSTINEIPHIMTFNEGQRAVILHIKTKLLMTAQRLKELENERGQPESD